MTKKTQAMLDLDKEFEAECKAIGQDLQEMLIKRISPLLRRLEAFGPAYEESRLAQYLAINHVIVNCLPTYRGEQDECTAAICMADLMGRMAKHAQQEDHRDFFAHVMKHAVDGPHGPDPLRELLEAMGFEDLDIGIPGVRGFRGRR